MRLLVSKELEFAVVRAGATVTVAGKISRTEDIRYLIVIEERCNIPSSVHIVVRGSCCASSWWCALFGAERSCIYLDKGTEVGNLIFAYSVSSTFGVSSV
jgi:hypothetical protein